MADRMDISRRRLLVAALPAAGLAVAAPALAAALAPTPRQGAGPFYPRVKPVDSDADLVTVAGRPGPAAGEIAYIGGRVLDGSGRPVPGARIEIWQSDAFGYYHHPRDRGGTGGDPNFQGYGRTIVDSGGAYRFRTIKPVPYPGRTPHIHFAVSGPGFAPLVTQMYVAGHPQNDGDFVLSRIRDADARARVIVPLVPRPGAETGALSGIFDIVLGGLAG